SYLVFYLMAGLAASAAHIVIRPESTLPVVGASGAIAGVMGAYAVLFPGARVTSIVPPFFFWPFAIPALLFLGIWFVSQFLLAGAESNIAWEAHVAGFAFGLIVAMVGRRWLMRHSTAVEHHYPVGRIYR
ncbi:MAG: rhomboid family intramembrane serine protease, partial [Acidimicrobiia bacterium]